MKLTTTITCMLIIPLLATAGCKDKKADGKTTSGAKKGAKGSYAPLTPDPAPAAITPADKPPFESVVFQKTGARTDEGWPVLNAYNLSTKAIKYIAITVYAY